MINYESDVCSDRFIISIEGHAGAAPEGKDIVCAAASILALALVEGALRLDESGSLEHFSRSVAKGSVEVDFTVKDWARERAESLVDTVTGGFLMLEEHYPEFVSVG